MHHSELNRYLLLIFIVGAVLRLTDLSGESIWVDEGRSMALARMPVAEIIEQNTLDNHPPLYYIFLHFWIQLFGTDEFSGRLPAALLGIASVALLYLVSRKLFNADTALYTSLIFSLAVFHVQYAQEIKTYAPATFLTLVSFYAFLHLREGILIHQLLLYMLATVMLLYTHFLAIPVVLAQNIIFLTDYLRKRDNRYLRVWLLIQTAIMLSFSPWLPYLFERTADLPGSFWLPPVTMLEIPKTLLIYAGTYTFPGIAALILYLALILVGLIRGNHQAPQYYVPAIWLIVPIAVPLLISVLHAPIYITRITIAASLPFYILAGNGMKKISNPHIRNQVLFILVILNGANLITYYSETNKERWRETVEILEKSADQTDIILVHAGFCIDNGIDFYRRRADLTIKPFPAERLRILPADTAKLAEEIRSRERIWLVRSHSRDTTDVIPATLRRDFLPEQLIFLRSRSFHSHKPYTGVEISRWSKRKCNQQPRLPEVFH